MNALKLFFILFLATGLVSCIGEEGEEEQKGANIKTGDKLPEFTIDMNDGSELTSANLQGKVSVIMLFSVTCNHCQKQFEITEKIYEKYKTNDNVVMFGISREQGEEQVGKYWKDKNYQMPYSAQSDRYIYSLFARSVVPRIYISDENRIVRKITTDDPIATEADLINAIDALLK